jgi:hypothetical protein
MLMLDKIFPGGIKIPDYFRQNIVHLPTTKCHIYTTTTGAMKNAFGGLLNTNRHYTHSHIHETLVDLLAIQKEIHTGIFAMMDGSTAGNGPGRASCTRRRNVILASGDQVAIDAVAAKMMGFDPMSLDYIRIAHEQEARRRRPERDRDRRRRRTGAGVVGVQGRRPHPQLHGLARVVRPDAHPAEAGAAHAARERGQPVQRGVPRLLPLAVERKEDLPALARGVPVGPPFDKYDVEGAQALSIAPVAARVAVSATRNRGSPRRPVSLCPFGSGALAVPRCRVRPRFLLAMTTGGPGGGAADAAIVTDDPLSGTGSMSRPCRPSPTAFVEVIDSGGAEARRGRTQGEPALHRPSTVTRASTPPSSIARPAGCRCRASQAQCGRTGRLPSWLRCDAFDRRLRRPRRY